MSAHDPSRGEPRLCCVSESDDLRGLVAYFTTQPVAQQWGDDWNDAPYEHNAGAPYEWREADGIGCRCIGGPGGLHTRCAILTARGEWTEADGHVQPKPRWEIVAVEFGPGRLLAPDDSDRHGGNCNSPWSVEAINAGATPWLTTRNRYTRHGDEHVDIWAGTTIREFCDAVRQADGEASLPPNMGRWQ